MDLSDIIQAAEDKERQMKTEAEEAEVEAIESGEAEAIEEASLEVEANLEIFHNRLGEIVKLITSKVVHQIRPSGCDMQEVVTVGDVTGKWEKLVYVGGTKYRKIRNATSGPHGPHRLTFEPFDEKFGGMSVKINGEFFEVYEEITKFDDEELEKAVRAFVTLLFEDE